MPRPIKGEKRPSYKTNAPKNVNHAPLKMTPFKRTKLALYLAANPRDWRGGARHIGTTEPKLLRYLEQNPGEEVEFEREYVDHLVRECMRAAAGLSTAPNFKFERAMRILETMYPEEWAKSMTNRMKARQLKEEEERKRKEQADREASQAALASVDLDGYLSKLKERNGATGDIPVDSRSEDAAGEDSIYASERTQ